MKIDTKYFGKVECRPSDLICFEAGVIGLEQYRQYLPIDFEEGQGNLLCLQSVEDPGLAFVVMNPFALYEDYRPRLGAADSKLLENTGEDAISWYVICTMKGSLEESSVNLKAPVAVNVRSRKACQVILEDDYSIRCPIGKGRNVC